MGCKFHPNATTKIPAMTGSDGELHCNVGFLQVKLFIKADNFYAKQ